MVRQVRMEEIPQLALLASRLWPHHTARELEEDLRETVARDDAALFMAWADAPVGFAQCQLRHDYVEGTDSSPVGYLEGIYVMEQHRKQGIARELLKACEEWAKNRGCREFASDCELENAQSLKFHLNVGFEEANRIICFTKKL